MGGKLAKYVIDSLIKIIFSRLPFLLLVLLGLAPNASFPPHNTIFLSREEVGSNASV